MGLMMDKKSIDKFEQFLNKMEEIWGTRLWKDHEFMGWLTQETDRMLKGGENYDGLIKRQIWDTFQISSILLVLFRKHKTGEMEIQDALLKKDFEIVIKTIKRLEDLEVNRSISTQKRMKLVKEKKKLLNYDNISEQKFISYKQELIRDLNSVLEKIPIHIRVDFVQYGDAFLKGGKFVFNKEKFVETFVPNKAAQYVSPKVRKESLGNIRFYPVAHDLVLSAELNDELIRRYLTYGLFDYIQRLSLRRPGRPRPCQKCGEWFLMEKANHFYCSKPCRDSYSEKSFAAKKKARENAKRYREKKKKC